MESHQDALVALQTTLLDRVRLCFLKFVRHAGFPSSGLFSHVRFPWAMPRGSIKMLLKE
jgi:hypothetical protein